MMKVGACVLIVLFALVCVCQAQVTPPNLPITSVPSCCDKLTLQVNALQAQINVLLGKRSLVQAGSVSSSSYWAWNNPKTGTAATVTKYIAFPIAYTSVPTVVTAIKATDIDEKHNLRIVTEAYSITTSGFYVRIRSWADTIVYSFDVTWIATGK